MRQCVWCRSLIPEDEAVCRYCQTPQSGGTSYNVGDRIRIRNRYKGMHVENVTVVSVGRQGTGLEVRDERGLLWGYIHPRDVLGPATSERERSA